MNTLTEQSNNKFSPEQIQLIEDCRQTIDELNDRQLKAYNEVVRLLPPLKPNELTTLWDYCWNNKTHTISLDKFGLKIKSILHD